MKEFGEVIAGGYLKMMNRKDIGLAKSKQNMYSSNLSKTGFTGCPNQGWTCFRKLWWLWPTATFVVSGYLLSMV